MPLPPAVHPAAVHASRRSDGRRPAPLRLVEAVPAPRHRDRCAELPPTWACENCEVPNAGRRRRCVDCGTSRY